MSEVPTLGSVARKLLLMELFVCFVPIVVLFSVVLIMAPLQLIVATGPQTRDGAWQLLWFLFCGISGLLALTRVVIWLRRA